MEKSKFNNWLYQCALDEFDLPNYDNMIYKVFIAECYFNDWKLQDHFGTPSVEVRHYELEDVVNSTSMDVSWSTLGDMAIVYPDIKYHAQVN